MTQDGRAAIGLPQRAVEERQAALHAVIDTRVRAVELLVDVPHAVPVQDFRHDLDSAVRRRMHTLHAPTGLVRQAVRIAEVAAGGRSTVLHTHSRTDEWLFILLGKARVRVGDDVFEAGPADFLGHPAGSPAHEMKALEDLTYLVGGEVDAADVVTYPEAGKRRVGGRLEPL